MSPERRTTLLVILDGFGHRTATEDNAILAAHTSSRQAVARGVHTLVSSSGLDVGLPDGQMGNSEVGHMSLGAGRIVYQSITRIDQAISTAEFKANTAYLTAIDAAVDAGKAVHIMGLLSPGVFTATKPICLPHYNWRQSAARRSCTYMPFWMVATPPAKRRALVTACGSRAKCFGYRSHRLSAWPLLGHGSR